MVAWFLIAIATLIIFAFIAVNSVQSLAMASDAGGRIETVKRLDTVASALVARATSPNNDGMIYLPVGENNPSGGGYGLPSYLGFQTQTPFGQRFVYCPFGDASGSGTTVSIPNADGSSYAVATATFEGRDYVVGGRPAYPGLSGQPNLMGFVMAPRSKLAASPSCSDVIYNSSTRKFEAPDAIVRPLTRESGVDESRATDSRQITFYVAPSGSGSGASASDPASLATATNFFASRIPAFMTINMAAGNYEMGISDLYLPTINELSGSTLKIRGVQNATFVDMPADAQIELPGDLSIDGVTFDADSQITVEANTRFTMVNSSVGRIHSKGDTVLAGTNSITEARDIYALPIGTGGTVHVEGTLSFITAAGKGFHIPDGGKLTLNYARVIFSRGNGVQYHRGLYSNGGKIAARFSNLEYPEGTDFGIHARGGDIHFTQMLMLFSGPRSLNGIFAYQGTRLVLHGSEIGSGVAPDYPIKAVGTGVIAGNGTTIRGVTSCWQGAQFSHSEPGAVGDESAVLPDVPVPGLSPSPTAAEIRAHGEALKTNSERAALRVSNTTNWLCSA